VTKPNIFRMETHCPDDFWHGLPSLTYLLYRFLLLSASKPGNAIIFSSEYFWEHFLTSGPMGKSLKIRSHLNRDIFLTFAH